MRCDLRGANPTRHDARYRAEQPYALSGPLGAPGAPWRSKCPRAPSVFHLLSFKHYFDQHELIGVQMSPGGLDRPWVTGSPIYYATRTDIENLRCIFPEGG